MSMREAMSMHLVYASLNQTKRQICFSIAQTGNDTPLLHEYQHIVHQCSYKILNMCLAYT